MSTPDHTHRSVTRAEALMWLNDHVGRPATVHVELDRGNYDVGVVSSAVARLAHWSRESHSPQVFGSRDDIAGGYHVGDVTVDLTDVGDAGFALGTEALRASSGEPGEELTVQIDENVQVRIIVFWETD